MPIKVAAHSTILGVALLVATFALLVSCTQSTGSEDYVQRTARVLEHRTIPPGAKVISRTGPHRHDSSAETSWEFETAQDWKDYRRWVGSQLAPDFAVVQSEDGKFVLARRDAGDVHTLTIQAIRKDSLYVHVTLVSRPD